MERKFLYRQGNLYTGYPFGVVVEAQFGSTDLHGPFSTETEAWNYGMDLAMESDGTKTFHVVKIETPHFKTIATPEQVREHRNA